jgi:microsomal dipeptidase-like Zn-dependent dipeptidase
MRVNSPLLDVTTAAPIRHAVNVAGVAHVGLGSDFDGATTTTFDASNLVLVTERVDV